MTPRQLVMAMIRYRNQQVAARELMPWQDAARARFYADHFAETLRSFGFKHARVWQPDPEKELVRVYIGRQGYVSVDREGPALFDYDRVAKERGQVTFMLSWLYSSQRDAWREALEVFRAWQQSMVAARDAQHDEFLATVEAMTPDDPDFVEYAAHLLEREAV